MGIKKTMKLGKIIIMYFKSLTYKFYLVDVMMFCVCEDIKPVWGSIFKIKVKMFGRILLFLFFSRESFWRKASTTKEKLQLKQYCISINLPSNFISMKKQIC